MSVRAVPLIGRDVLQERVGELAAAISSDYGQREILAVGVLKGAFVFLADLCRKIDVPVVMDFVEVSSYRNGTESPGTVRLVKDAESRIEGRHLLIVEDILDTGFTLGYLEELFLSRRPASLEVCALLEKPSRRKAELPVPVKYVGLRIPDVFVVGYGLDFAGKFRNLPDVCKLVDATDEREEPTVGRQA